MNGAKLIESIEATIEVRIVAKELNFLSFVLF